MVAPLPPARLSPGPVLPPEFPAELPWRGDRMTGSAVVTPVAPRLQRDRYVVPDVARGVAILAMLVAHAGPIMAEQPAATLFLQGQLNDLASPLFALTMGAAAAIVLAKAGR